MTRMQIVVIVVAALCGGSTAFGQNFNVDVGNPGSQPNSSYAAAGLAGVWNSVRGTHITPFTTGPTVDDDMLVDINGHPTGVGFHQFGGMDYVSTNDPSVSGNDGNLLNDYLATHSETLESCMYLNGLENGTYEVLTYAWMPHQPSVDQLVRFDFHPGTQLVGGSWPGQHIENVTYSRDIIEVTNGFIGFHVGIPSGGDTGIGAAFNGFQLRLLGEEPIVPAASEWGLIVIALTILVGASILFRYQRRPAAYLA